MKNITLLFFIAVFIGTAFPYSLPASLYPARPFFGATDRRQTKSPFFVNGVLQVEMGVQTRRTTFYTNNFDYKQVESAYPDILVRYSPSDGVELRLATGYHAFDYNGESVSGLGPVSIGTKLFLCGGSGLLPRMSFIGSVALPVLSHEKFRPSVIAPALRLAACHKIKRRWEVGYNLGVEWQGANTQPAGVYALGLTFDLSYVLRDLYNGSLHGTTSAFQSADVDDHQPGESYYLDQNITAFAELSGDISKSGTSTTLSGGFAYALSPRVKLDASVGVGLNRNSPDYVISAGLSFRTE